MPSLKKLPIVESLLNGLSTSFRFYSLNSDKNSARPSHTLFELRRLIEMFVNEKSIKESLLEMKKLVIDHIFQESTLPSSQNLSTVKAV